MNGIADITQERIRLRITGEDRTVFLHGQCTNDLQRLPVGGDCFVAFLNVKGKMRGEGHLMHQPNEWLVECNPGMRESLEKFVITEDVVIEELNWRQYLVVGAPVPAGITFRHPLGTGLLTAAELPVNLDAVELETLRIESGVPKWGADLDENTIPVEAGLVSAISYDKGCYVGQETIARIRTYGHVNRMLIQFQVRSAEVPKAGAKILAGEREVGQVTSVALSNRLGKVVGLGYVRREVAVIGTNINAGGHPAEVIKPCSV